MENYEDYQCKEEKEDVKYREAFCRFTLRDGFYESKKALVAKAKEKVDNENGLDDFLRQTVKKISLYRTLDEGTFMSTEALQFV